MTKQEMKHIIYLFLLIFLTSAANAQGVANSLNNAQKVYGLSKLWQEANYNFVYIDKVDRKAWDSLYMAMITTVQQTKDDYEYYHELQRFYAFLKDGHTNVNFPDYISNRLLTNNMFGKYRFAIENIDGRAIITHVNLSQKDEVPPASEIIEVNGLSTPEYMRQFVKPYISSSTDYVLDDRAAARLLMRLMGDKYAVKIRTPDGTVKPLDLTLGINTEEYYPKVVQHDLLELKWFPNEVAYLALNGFDNPKIDSLFIKVLPELYKAKSLIIDLRSNGGGSTEIGAFILKYFSNGAVLTGSKSSTRIHEAAFKAWGAGLSPKDTTGNEWNKKAWLDFQDLRFEDLGQGEVVENNLAAKKIIIPTVLLIGHNTASAAEDFLILADKQKQMITMGENSFGSTGQPFTFQLPGGGSARVCTKKDTYPDGREFVGYGVKPTIEVKKTVNDFIENKDPVLDKALSYLRGK